jgi:hypothetical protein
MTDPNDWDFSDEHWGEPRPEPVTARRATTAAHPARLDVPLYTVEARLIILHLLVAASLPVIFFCGQVLYRSGYLPELIVGSVIVAFIYGLKRYITAIRERVSIASTRPGLRTSDLPGAPSLVTDVLKLCLFAPLVIGLASVFAVWSQNHFVAILNPAIACFAAFFYLGSKPIEFWQEYLMAQPEIELDDLRFRPRGSGEPDLKLLGVMLFLLLTAPILLSTAHAILLFALLIGGSLALKLRRLGHRNSSALLIYLLHRCHVLLHVYLDYKDVYRGQEMAAWVPPSSRVQRFQTFIVLGTALFTVLLTGLTYYCPWEFFAALFVPSFKASPFLVPSTKPLDYDWLRLPFFLAFQAEPIAGYLLTFILAIGGSLLFPPAVLLALYFERLVELETLNQEIKRYRRSY